MMIAILALLGYARLNKPSLPPQVVKGDGEGYYAYLSGYLLDRDPSFRTLVRRRFTTDELVGLSGLSYQPRTGRYLDKYSPGQALLTLPFFAVGHAVATIRGERADGYSRSEELSSGLAAIAWAVAGLAAVRRVLLRWFSDPVTAVVLACVSLGTGLFHYMAYDSSYSHAFSFSAVCFTSLAVIRWIERPGSRRRAVEVGLAAGLVACVRPANIVAIGPMVLFGVVSGPTLRARALLLGRHWHQVLLGAAAASPFVLANLLVWRIATGRLLFFSYRADEGFSFLHPQWGVLFSFRPHGLLPYAPVLVLALLGMAALWCRARWWFWPAALSFLLETYLLASWRAWPLGDGFGHRGYVDIVGVLAVPMAALLAAVWRSRWRWAVGGLAAVATVSTMLGALAYWQNRLPHDGASPRNYLAAIVGGDSSNGAVNP